MGPRCFVKENSIPPLCGVHNVPLKLHQSSEDSRIEYFGNFTFYMCPVSHDIVSDPPTSINRMPWR